MTNEIPNTYTGFQGHRHIASGSLQGVALAVKHAIESGSTDPILIFDDATGRSVDMDIRGSDEEVAARFAQTTSSIQTSADPIDSDTQVDEPRGRGRPKLGVVAREVTLLPRHWDWLATQPGGASVALRKLVEAARKTHSEKDTRRESQARAYRFISAVAGDFPNFEEASRALFANDQTRFSQLIAEWADDVRDYAITLAFGSSNHLLP